MTCFAPSHVRIAIICCFLALTRAAWVLARAFGTSTISDPCPQQVTLVSCLITSKNCRQRINLPLFKVLRCRSCPFHCYCQAAAVPITRSRLSGCCCPRSYHKQCAAWERVIPAEACIEEEYVVLVRFFCRPLKNRAGWLAGRHNTHRRTLLFVAVGEGS